MRDSKILNLDVQQPWEITEFYAMISDIGVGHLITGFN